MSRRHPWIDCAFGLVLAACGAPAGDGVGALVTTTSAAPTQPVAFRWRADDSASGSLTARLPSGEAFVGTYEQRVVPKADPDVPAARPRRDQGDSAAWPEIDQHGDTSYGQHFTHDVTATLRGTAGGTMNCRFRLTSRSAGMAGGGHGECLVNQIGKVEAFFPPE